jgi:hypothetical protein
LRRVSAETLRVARHSAAADAPWVTLAATGDQGAATVNYSVLPNPDGMLRRSRVVVARREVDVAQALRPAGMTSRRRR